MIREWTLTRKINNNVVNLNVNFITIRRNQFLDCTVYNYFLIYIGSGIYCIACVNLQKT